MLVGLFILRTRLPWGDLLLPHFAWHAPVFSLYSRNRCYVSFTGSRGGGIHSIDEGSMQDHRSVLVIDDDPNHLQIYGWILESAGFTPFLALARNDGIEMPKGHAIDVTVLNYRLTGNLKATDAAKLVNEAFPETPIVLLSDLYGLPDDIAPYVQAFVRKGEPEMLIATVRRFAELPVRGGAA
jgi:CheY-like chemotaxis protein